MKAPIAGVTHYKGWRIVFDGEFFTCIDEGTARFFDIRTLQRARDMIDQWYSLA